MNILILGLGSIAKKHIKALNTLFKDFKIYALRSSNEAETYLNVINIYEIDKLKKIDFNFSIISSPTFLHEKHIKIVNDLSIPMFIEKPITYTLDSLNRLKKLNINNKINYVACNLRFSKVILFLKDFIKNNNLFINEINSYCGSFLPEWRPEIEYTKSYSSSKKLGGGVHLDLIHEPDYLFFLFGEPINVIKNYRKVSKLKGDSIDSASIIFHYKDFNANVTLNYFRKDPKRSLEIIHSDGTIHVDFIDGKIIDLINNKVLFRTDENIQETYVDQMTYFVNCINKKLIPENNIDNAIKITNYII